MAGFAQRVESICMRLTPRIKIEGHNERLYVAAAGCGGYAVSNQRLASG
jgi:hypothetical protein